MWTMGVLRLVTHFKYYMQMKLSENLGQDWDKIGTGNHKTYDIMVMSRNM